MAVISIALLVKMMSFESISIMRSERKHTLGYGFLFAFHSKYGRIFSRFDTIHERDRQTPHDGISRAAITVKSVIVDCNFYSASCEYG